MNIFHLGQKWCAQKYCLDKEAYLCLENERLALLFWSETELGDELTPPPPQVPDTDRWRVYSRLTILLDKWLGVSQLELDL